jgi:CRP/FNR family cyclic AMP-dependent transcriptional regulator
VLEERRRAEPTPARPRSTSLLDLDPDLGIALARPRFTQARLQLPVAHARFPAGPWSAGRFARAPGQLFGLLVYRGIAARELTLGSATSLELVGAGDVLRPWDAPPGASMLGHSERWSVIAELRVAVLDRRLTERLAAYPEIVEALGMRLSERSQRLAVTQAISQLTRVDDRLLMMLWHLVERWGRMTGDGAVLPLALSHRQLAQLVGARRPSASSALSALARSGRVLRRDDGTWLLPGEPPGVRDLRSHE